MRFFLCALLAAALLSAAETLPEDRGPAALWQALQGLQTPTRILYVTAHPDDEDPALLTYLARGLGAEVTLLILNRGEGGANVVSGDFFEALGALRSVEMLRAAQHYGVQVRFTRAVDYGFSKNIAEALRAWNEKALLADAIAIARAVQPQIVISRFNESERDGHGHHQAAGRIARLLFAQAATADWKPAKLYTTNWREGEPVTLKIDTGQFNPLLGRSYAQIGREGYRWHRSQGMASNVARPGPVYAYLKREDANTPESSLLDHLPAAKADPHVQAGVRAFDALHPEKCAPHLAAALRDSPDPARQRALSRALALALSLEFEALVEPDLPPTGPFAQFRSIETVQVVQPGQTFQARLNLHQRGAEKVDKIRYAVRGPFSSNIARETGVFTLRVAEEAPASAAAWSRAHVRDSFYQIQPPSQFSLPLPNTGIAGLATFTYQGVEVSLEAELESTSGAIRQPLVIGPALSVKFDASFSYSPQGQRAHSLTVSVTNLSANPQAGELRLALPAGFAAVPALPFRLAKTAERVKIPFSLALPASLGPEPYEISAHARVGPRDYSASFEAVTQPGLRVAYLSQPARHTLRLADVKFSASPRVGYIMGSGDEVPEALRQLGVPVELIDSSTLAGGDLSRFSAILVGIRAYAVREDLKAHNQRLLDFAAAGGNVVVQYQTQEYDRNFAPFPYTQGRGAEEVSEEDAPVTILAPAHPVFNTPNKIGAEDFEAWVEQRGSKFFSTWDARWTPLVETHDHGQAPQKGVCLTAPTGRGHYTYCSLAFYRQLPYAVPGAARLLANLLSLGR